MHSSRAAAGASVAAAAATAAAPNAAPADGAAAAAPPPGGAAAADVAFAAVLVSASSSSGTYCDALGFALIVSIFWCLQHPVSVFSFARYMGPSFLCVVCFVQLPSLLRSNLFECSSVCLQEARRLLP